MGYLFLIITAGHRLGLSLGHSVHFATYTKSVLKHFGMRRREG
jgi:hypothetical protein